MARIGTRRSRWYDGGGDPERLVDLGILITDGAGRFRTSDVQRVRCSRRASAPDFQCTGLQQPYGKGGCLWIFWRRLRSPGRWAVRSTQTYRQVSQDTGIPLDALGSVLESMGFARMAPDEPILVDELEGIVPMLQLAHSMGNLDQGLARIGRAWTEGLRLAATAENQDYTSRFGRLLESGTDLWDAKEKAAWLATELLPLVDRALRPGHRRQQELVGPKPLWRTSKTSWMRPGCWGDLSACRLCASWIWWATRD